MGGNKIVTEGDLSTPTTDLSNAKLHVNSTISTEGAHYGCFDISNFYLKTPMAKDQFAYAKEHIKNIPNDIVERYNLRDLANSRGYVLIEIRRGMYGLPIAGKIAHEALVAHLEPYGYSTC